MFAHLKLPSSNSLVLPMCMLLAISASVCADSVNWTSTVGDTIASMDQSHFRYDVDPRPATKRMDSRSCLECAPALALQLDADERLGQRLRHTYRKFGEDLAARLWDDPKGRRVRFDVDGRPGLGLQIPLD